MDGIRRFQPDVLLLDIRMPRMTGIQALHAMTDLERGVTVNKSTRNYLIIVGLTSEYRSRSRGRHPTAMPVRSPINSNRQPGAGIDVDHRKEDSR